MEKIRRTAERYGKQLGLTGAALLAFIEQAVAAVPTEVTTALSDAKADMGTIASAIFVAIIALLGWKLMRKAAR